MYSKITIENRTTLKDMLILLYGQDTYRSYQKLNEIIQKYKNIHKTGLDFVMYREDDLHMNKIRQKIESVSMFNEKKLIILENIFQNKEFLKEFLDYAKKNRLKDNKDVIVVIYEKGNFQVSGFRFEDFNMFQEFRPLSNYQLINWIAKETNKRGGEIENLAAQKLAQDVGNDLWRVSNEIDKLINYKNGQVITEKDIDLLVSSKIDTYIFKTIDAFADRDKKTALRLLYEHLEKGEKEIYLLSMLTYQIRNLIKLKDLQERGVPYYALTKKTGLHPYVIKKTMSQLKKFDLNELKNIYKQILEAEISIKTGKIEPKVALDLLVNSI